MTTYNGDDTEPAVAAWTPEEAENLYRMHSWGNGFFGVNEAGHVAVSPSGNGPLTVDLYRIVEHLRRQRVTFPVLIRFQDVLRARVAQLSEAFRGAIRAFDYENRYVGVYPIKVNQLHEVVEEILDAGLPYGLGLECGSKAELVAALPHLESDDTLLLCNGYKDAVMQRLILTGQQLGKAVIPVVEKVDELERFLQEARGMDVRPRLGVRVNLSTVGAGRWAASSGDQSKFGVSVSELLLIIDRLEADEVLDAFVLLHFHLGSQIADIQVLKQAVKEITRIYAHLHRKGVPIRYLDVGGGLGVNYVASYTGYEDSINYTLQEYANSVVYAVKEVCDEEKVPHPQLISESGRALTAHHSVLVVEVLASYAKREIDAGFTPQPGDHLVVHELFASLEQARGNNGGRLPANGSYARLLEAYHDAVEKREQANTLFGLGYLPVQQKALADGLYWALRRIIQEHVAAEDRDDVYVPVELQNPSDRLTDQYLCDFSVFQSILDYWAIGQRFPIMPLHRLDEAPDRQAVLVDLTCDSDGKVCRFIDPEGEKTALEVHALKPGDPYFLGFFLMGAYQDIMGDVHNLFGRVTEAHVYADDEEPDGFYVEKIIPGWTIREMLAHVQYFPSDLQRRMERLIRNKVNEGVIRAKTGVDLLDRYRAAFDQPTYLDTYPPLPDS